MTSEADEKRAARSLYVEVEEAEWGWRARSESGTEYHLVLDPKSGQLQCSCPDFVYRSDMAPDFECKHIRALIYFLGRRYLEILHHLGLGYDRRGRTDN